MWKVTHAQRRPLLFRVVTPWRWLVWDESGVAQGHVDASCIVVPNVPEQLGEWGMRYERDFDFISGTAQKWGGVQLIDNVIVWTRPTGDEDWTAKAGMYVHG